MIKDFPVLLNEEAQPTPINLRGFKVFQDVLNLAEQEAIVEDLRGILRRAPLFSPQTPYGKPMSVRMTSCGRYGWFSDRQGYRYTEEHPNGTVWPAIPERILSIWKKLGSNTRGPDSCLINFYGESTRMGMHQDKDEADFSWPVLSISLGDDALFRAGNRTRGGKTESVWLRSGDVVLMSGEARLAYHGIDKIRFQSSALLPNGGRINLTLRVVD